MSKNLSADDWQFSAFISYAQADNNKGKHWNRWLQTELENYPISRKVADATPYPYLIKNSRLREVCLDEINFVPGKGLAKKIKDKLARSHTLIVLCSPKSQRAMWVEQEISVFQELHPDREIIPVTIAVQNEQDTKDNPFCFPSTLLGSQNRREGSNKHQSEEPLSADFRIEIEGEMHDGYTDLGKLDYFMLHEFDIVSEQMQKISEKYASKRLEQLHKIVAAILDVSPKLLKQEYVPNLPPGRSYLKPAKFSTVLLLIVFLGIATNWFLSGREKQMPATGRTVQNGMPLHGKLEAKLEALEAKLSSAEEEFQQNSYAPLLKPLNSISQDLTELKTENTNLTNTSTYAWLAARYQFLWANWHSVNRTLEIMSDDYLRPYEILKRKQLPEALPVIHQDLLKDISIRLSKAYLDEKQFANAHSYIDVAISIVKQQSAESVENESRLKELIELYDYSAGIYLRNGASDDANIQFKTALNITDELIRDGTTDVEYRYYHSKFIFFATTTETRWGIDESELFNSGEQITRQLNSEFPYDQSILVLAIQYINESHVRGFSAQTFEQIKNSIQSVNTKLTKVVKLSPPTGQLVQVYTGFIREMLVTCLELKEYSWAKVAIDNWLAVFGNIEYNQENKFAIESGRALLLDIQSALEELEEV